MPVLASIGAVILSASGYSSVKHARIAMLSLFVAPAFWFASLASPLFTVSCIAASIPTNQNAAHFIPLNEQQKKAVSKGEIVVREMDRAGNKGRTFEAIGLVKAPREKVVEVLKDYQKYPEFMPNVSHVEIVEQAGNEAVLNYTLTLPLGKIKKYRLRISGSALTDKIYLLEWHLEKWPGLKREETISDTTGYWRVEEKGEGLSLVLYHVYTDPGPVPFGLGWIVDVLSKKSVPDVLLQTKRRAEKVPGNQ